MDRITFLPLPEPEVGSHINVYTSKDDCEEAVQVGVKDGGRMVIGYPMQKATANLILRGDGTLLLMTPEFFPYTLHP